MRNWQQDAPQEIARIHAAMPDCSPDDLRKALRRESSAFSYGTSWGKKVWAKQCRAYLAKMTGRGAYRSDGRDQVWPADVAFPWKGESDAMPQDR